MSDGATEMLYEEKLREASAKTPPHIALRGALRTTRGTTIEFLADQAQNLYLSARTHDERLSAWIAILHFLEITKES